MFRSLITALTAAALLALASSPGPAQNPELAPSFGELHLAVGFLPDPAVHAVMAGGGEAMLQVAELHTIDAVRGNACGSFVIDAAPSVRLYLDETEASGFRFLRIFADVPAGSGTDPALLIRRPDGSWRCADDGHVDTYQGLMPIIDLEDPPPGAYDIWVGSYLRNPAAPATLYFTAYRTHLPSASGY